MENKQYKCIFLPEQKFVLVDEQAVIGLTDWCINITKQIRRAILDAANHLAVRNEDSLIIATSQNNKLPNIPKTTNTYQELLDMIEDAEIDKKVFKYNNLWRCDDWVEGYKAAKEKGVYSKEQLVAAMEHSWHEAKQTAINFPDSYINKYLLQISQLKNCYCEIEFGMTEGWIPTYNNPDNHNLDPSAEPDGTATITKINL